MEVGRGKRGLLQRNERRFTLPEMLTTIAILGILLAIAIVIWNSIMESRQVDSAANQLASDLRLANTRATNQLTDWRVVVTDPNDSSEGECDGDYCLVRLEEPYTEESDEPEIDNDFSEHELPGGTEIYFDGSDADATTVPADPSGNGTDGGTNNPSIPGRTHTVEFNSDGTARALGSPSGTFVVSAEGGDPSREIVFQSATARIELKD